MSKAERFEGLKDLAGGRETSAAHRLAESLNEVKSQEAELRRLRDFLNDYREEAGDAALDTARWRNSRLFLSRLNDAVSLREGALETAKERYRQEAENWRECYRQTKALEKLVDKYYREDIQETVRRDQKDLDEQVTRDKWR